MSNNAETAAMLVGAAGHPSVGARRRLVELVGVMVYLLRVSSDRAARGAPNQTEARQAEAIRWALIELGLSNDEVNATADNVRAHLGRRTRVAP